MPLAKDMVALGDFTEQAIRLADIGPALIQASSVSTQTSSSVSIFTPGNGLVGGPTGNSLLEINPSTPGNSSITFVGTTEIDREYVVYNVATTASTGGSVGGSSTPAFFLNVYPAVGGNFQGLGNNVPFSIGINKTASVTRLGKIPPTSTSTLTMGTIATDRWIYVLSA